MTPKEMKESPYEASLGKNLFLKVGSIIPYTKNIGSTLTKASINKEFAKIACVGGKLPILEADPPPSYD